MTNFDLIYMQNDGKTLKRNMYDTF